MSSRQRNLRKKPSLVSFDADDDANQEQGSVALPPAAKAAQTARDKQRKAEKKTLLSFEEDVGGDDADGGPLKAKPPKPKGNLRAPGAVVPPPADERASRVYTQIASAGLQGACSARHTYANILQCS
jgi:hypothetical protein